jgi:2-C-methyl-D-erythritol 2,4-cyclodiphosphate synthase
VGHSDADVLIHAVIDALLGAAGLGDIGRHFPDTDPTYAGVSSLLLLAETGRLIREAGYELGNVDAVVVAQSPRLASHMHAMEANMADALGVQAQQVHIKATTTEGLGLTGRKEGIAAQAVALLHAGIAGTR